MCVHINLGISSAGLPGISGMASQARGVLKHPEHHARHATGEIPPTLSYPGLWKPFLTTAVYPASKRHFNYCLSRARVIVEHAYGRLKGRWRCLLKRNDVLIRDLPKLVAACCVLHNICEIHGETFNEEWMSDIADHNSVNTVTCSTASTSLESSGRDVRQALMAYFSQ